MPCQSTLLHHDPSLLALDKPSGLSLATPRHAPNDAVQRLIEALPEAERRRAGVDTTTPLWLVHRLDVGTSGVVLLARNADAHRALSRAFGDRQVEKRYLALVWGRPKPRASVYDAPLGPDRADRRRMRVDAAGSPATTHYEIRGFAKGVSLVELRPETGRTHQIRVHLAHAGHPIVGDDLYGGPRHRGVKDPQLRRQLAPAWTYLHAWRLILAQQRFEAPLPEPFARVLATLGITLIP